MAFAASTSKAGVIHIYRWALESSSVGESRIEIEAHEGGVHDLALTTLDGSPVAISGGGDCLVKVWNASNGRLMFKFTGGCLPAVLT